MVFHIDVLPSSCRECFVKGGHCVWAIRVISLAWWCIPKMPMDATVFCRFDTSCIVTCQISHHSVWEDSRNPNPIYSKYHLLILSCHSRVRMAHWKSPNNFPPRLFFHSLCIRSSLHSTRPHRPFVGPGPSLSAASTVAPAARSCSRMAVWPATAAWCSGVAPQAPKGSETSTAGGLHPVALHRQTPAAVGETAICRVNSVSFIFFKIV